MSIISQIGIPDDPVANDQKIFSAGRIPYSAFKVVDLWNIDILIANLWWRSKVSIAVLYSVAVVTVIIRIVTRLFSRHRVYLDDVLLLFAFMCLSAATGLVYSFGYKLWYNEASKLDATVVISVTDILDLMYSLPYIDAFLALTWTCTFSVKFSFLALFRLLIRRLSRVITVYYWCVVGFCILTWMFLIGEAFILCPYFGLQSSELSQRPTNIDI